MSSPARFRLDRHLFASNATAYNAAWESYGWTAGLDRARAGRLEERVPWAAELGELADPPVLIDGGGGVASGIGALPEAFLPLDGRLGFSVSGVVRVGEGALPGGRVRIATHTVLFDTAVFAAIDGYPQGLGVDPGASVPAVPGVLPELECEPHVEWFRAARLREVARLAALAGVSMGGPDLVDLLTGAYLAVLRSVGGGPGCVVVGKPGEDCVRGAAASDLVRLVWLSLPLKDRDRLYYSTTWLGGRRPEPCLTVAPEDEWSPETGREVVHVRAPENGAGVGDGAETLAGERVRAWAELVLEGGRDLARVAKRMDVRGMSLGEGRSGPYVVYGIGVARGRAGVVERARVEAAAVGRWRGLGRVAAEEACRLDDAEVPRWMEAVLGDRRLAHHAAFFDGVVRGVRGRVCGREMARFAVVAGVRCGRRAAGLGVVVEAVRVLVEGGVGGEEIGAVIALVDERDGRGAAVEMTRIAMGVLQISGRAPEVAALMGSLRDEVAGDPAVIADAASIAETWLADEGTAQDGWQPLLRRIWGGAAGVPGSLDVDALHRLAWLEYRARGGIVPLGLAGAGAPGAARLLHRLLGRNPDPPLTIFLVLRRALAEEAAP